MPDSSISKFFEKSRAERLKIIGNFEMENPSLDLEVIQWNKENEVRDLQDIDIGLYPLPG